MEYIILPETASTNTWCREHSSELTPPVVVMAETQSAGRGQRGNYWEASPGKNLTFSMLWNPAGIAPSEQFAISEAVALGVVNYLHKRGIEATVKWPNDIYVDNRKICGILIEHSILGSFMERSVIGVGININQEKFISDAPNPVSLTQLTGKMYDLVDELKMVSQEIEAMLRLVANPEGRESAHRQFLQKLWRGDGKSYPFRDKDDGEEFMGVIEGVEPAGFLCIRKGKDEVLKRYAFKEVEFILKV